MTQDARGGEPCAVLFEDIYRLLAAMIGRRVIDNENRKFWKVLPNE